MIRCPYCEARRVDAWHQRPATACVECNAALFAECLRVGDEETIDRRLGWLFRFHPETLPRIRRRLAAERARVAQEASA